MVSKKNGNAEGGRPKRKRRSGSGGGGDDLAILRARCEKLQAKLDRLEAKHREAIAANKEKIREKAREKRQRRRDEKVRRRDKPPKSARRGRRTLTYRQIDERYIARGRAIPMKADAAWESELEEMNRGKGGPPVRVRGRPDQNNRHLPADNRHALPPVRGGGRGYAGQGEHPAFHDALPQAEPDGDCSGQGSCHRKRCRRQPRDRAGHRRQRPDPAHPRGVDTARLEGEARLHPAQHPGGRGHQDGTGLCHHRRERRRVATPAHPAGRSSRKAGHARTRRDVPGGRHPDG